ncbi:MAG TPA: GGDEF domain-containing protein [Gaiellaceae bacterium]|nr:GGDEF domain-containing protein [Gaiellaceae bacterium]
MSAALVNNRRVVLALAAAAYAAVLASFIVLEHGGLGIAHFFYVPICLVALASDALWGALAGALATGLYAVGVVVAPHVHDTHALPEWAGIRLVTFALAGALVGWYASSNRTLIGRLREHALQDFLTGLGNARVFDETLARRCANGHPFTLVLADMDDLKGVNDAHGHEAGNDALRRVAEVLRAHTGQRDCVARVGGDEFAILSDLTPEQAALMCARIAQTLAHDELHLSFGTTAFPQDGSAAVELFRKADDRLFTAKLLNRNRKTVLYAAKS